MAQVEETDDSSVTRIYVSGLPPSTTREQVRSHFAATGKYTVTDAHVIPDRRIAFVGFSSHDQAKSAVQYFNRSFVRMSKISVTLAKPVQVKRDDKGQAVPVSERASKKRKRHANDDGERAAQFVVREAPRNPGKAVVEPDEKKLASEEKENTSREHVSGDDFEDENAPQGPKSDLDWLRAKTTRTLDLLDETEVDRHSTKDRTHEGVGATDAPMITEEGEPEQDDMEMSKGPEEDVSSQAALSVPNARLFVRNLPFGTQEDDLRAAFAPHGRISEVSPLADSVHLPSAL
jgi:multiple RNA-binding domain-containing protein 1